MTLSDYLNETQHKTRFIKMSLFSAEDFKDRSYNDATCKSFSHSAIFVFIFSRGLRDSTLRFVGPSVGRSVGPLFTFSAFLSFLGSQLLPKCHYKSL